MPKMNHNAFFFSISYFSLSSFVECNSHVFVTETGEKSVGNLTMAGEKRVLLWVELKGALAVQFVARVRLRKTDRHLRSGLTFRLRVEVVTRPTVFSRAR